MDGAMLASIQIAEHKARAAATFRRETKVFEDGIQLIHLNYLLAFDGIIASRGGIPLIEQGKIIGAIGCSGGTDSQDEVVSKAGAAVICYWHLASTTSKRRSEPAPHASFRRY
jgi:uncharacterized protein GlcG (DUF336 family)